MGRLSFKRLSLIYSVILFITLLPITTHAVVHVDTLETNDGTSGAPSHSFTKEQNSGVYRAGTADIVQMVNGLQAIEMEKNLAGTGINFGFGPSGTVGNSNNNPYTFGSSLNGIQYYQFGNTSTGTSSTTSFQILDGTPNLNVTLAFENHAYQTVGYLAGADVIYAGSSVGPQFNIANEWGTNPNITFNLGSSTLASGNEYMVLTQTALNLKNGAGNVNLSGSSSGVVSINTQAASGTYNFNLPTTAGSAGAFLTSQGGSSSAMTWTTALGAVPTKQLFTSTGTVTGYLFTVSGISVAPTAGATYTNNGNTVTVIGITNSNTLLWVSIAGSASFTGTTLTKSTGTGDATITFVLTSTASARNPQSLSTYTPTAGTNFIKGTCVGAGGGGGGAPSAAVNSAAGGGGGGGATTVKWITTPAGSYYFTVGAGGAGGSAGANAGTMGTYAAFGSGSTFFVAPGGVGGAAGSDATTPIPTALGGTGGVATGGDLNTTGGVGTWGIVFGSTGIGNVQGGAGGSSTFGAGANYGNNAAGISAGLYGGGGGGGSQLNNGGTQPGGTGGQGFCLFEEFTQ